MPIAEIAPGDIVAPVGGLHRPRRHAHHRRQGLLRHPGRPHRRVPARREGSLRELGGRPGRRRHLRPQGRLLPGQHGRLRLGARPRGQHRNEDLPRQRRRRPLGAQGRDGLRQRHQGLRQADGALHARHGLDHLPHRRDHQARLARGPPLRPLGRRGPHPGDASHDRHRLPLQGGGLHVPQEGHRQEAQGDTEPRIDGHPLHGQDGHDHPGQGGPRAPRRRDEQAERGRPALRLDEQLLSDGPAQPPRPLDPLQRGPRRRAHPAARSTKSPSTSSGSACR